MPSTHPRAALPDCGLLDTPNRGRSSGPPPAFTASGDVTGWAIQLPTWNHGSHQAAARATRRDAPEFGIDRRPPPVLREVLRHLPWSGGLADCTTASAARSRRPHHRPRSREGGWRSQSSRTGAIASTRSRRLPLTEPVLDDHRGMPLVDGALGRSRVSYPAVLDGPGRGFSFQRDNRRHMDEGGAPGRRLVARHGKPGPPTHLRQREARADAPLPSAQ